MISGFKLNAKQRREELQSREERLLASAGCFLNQPCVRSRGGSPQRLLTLFRPALVLLLFHGAVWRDAGDPHVLLPGSLRCGREGLGWLENQGPPPSFPTSLLMRARDLSHPSKTRCHPSLIPAATSDQLSVANLHISPF